MNTSKKWVEDYIERELVMCSHGDYVGIREMDLQQLVTLKGMVEMQINHIIFSKPNEST